MVVPAEFPAALDPVRDLFREYAQSLGFSLCFQGFDEELAGLPGRYARPQGEFLLGLADRAPVGCIALRPLEPGLCEMKRLFVRPAFRGSGLGRALTLAIIAAARGRGYRAIRLDTTESMTVARGIYGKLGFRPIAPYNASPLPDLKHFELDLGGAA
ncbi:MAG: GNAT family N-acetyltransferase [Azospirillum sp.]|nr:GNAT family N-acetyltransferase [Azospirillum sp.]